MVACEGAFFSFFLLAPYWFNCSDLVQNVRITFPSRTSQIHALTHGESMAKVHTAVVDKSL